VSNSVTTFFLYYNFKISVIIIITVLNCELFCQTATYLLLEGKTCCGLNGMNLWTKKLLQYRLASLLPAMNCTISSALTEAHKDGHKLTCRAIATTILTGALGTILAVTFLSTVLTKCALWTQLTAVCAPISYHHRNIHQNILSDHSQLPKKLHIWTIHYHHSLSLVLVQLNHCLPHAKVISSLYKPKFYTHSPFLYQYCISHPSSQSWLKSSA